MEKITISRDEVLRYLGHKNQTIDQSTEKLINECIGDIENTKGAKYTYKICNINVGENEVEVFDTSLRLRGKDILRHLKECSKCVIMGATLGIEIDNMIRYYEKDNLVKSIILDACATTAIENLCDNIEYEIKNIANKEDLSITSRYSPGYGDLSLEVQPQILNLLDSFRKIGLSVTDDFILIPRKSVTAIIGFKKGEQKDKILKCEGCNIFKGCTYRKGGKVCEN